MLLAIVGALMVIDRQFAFFFADLLVLAIPVMIIFYSTKFEIRDGLILSVCFIILTLILGSITSYAILPISILVGIVYSIGLKKDFSKRRLLGISIIMFIIGEVLVSFIVLPLLGIDYVGNELALANETLNQMNQMTGGLINSVIGSAANNIMMFALIFTVILLGVAEGWIIHMFSILLLTRFKVKEIKVTNILDFKMNKIVAYISFLCVFGFVFLFQIDITNDILFYVVAGLSTTSALILIYVGILFIMNYGIVVLNKNLTLFLVLFILFFTPITILGLIILGFLYGAGPLYDYLQRKRSERNEKPN